MSIEVEDVLNITIEEHHFSLPERVARQLMFELNEHFKNKADEPQRWVPDDFGPPHVDPMGPVTCKVPTAAEQAEMVNRQLADSKLMHGGPFVPMDTKPEVLAAMKLGPVTRMTNEEMKHLVAGHEAAWGPFDPDGLFAKPKRVDEHA